MDTKEVIAEIVKFCSQDKFKGFDFILVAANKGIYNVAETFDGSEERLIYILNDMIHVVESRNKPTNTIN